MLQFHVAKSPDVLCSPYLQQAVMRWKQHLKTFELQIHFVEAYILDEYRVAFERILLERQQAKATTISTITRSKCPKLLYIWLKCASNGSRCAAVVCGTHMYACRLMPSEHKSALVRVSVWRRKVTRHYLSQCCRRILTHIYVTTILWYKETYRYRLRLP